LQASVDGNSGPDGYSIELDEMTTLKPETLSATLLPKAFAMDLPFIRSIPGQKKLRAAAFNPDDS
jgi:hypothetical protein